MGVSIKLNDFRWEPGKNDAEYIKLLESSRDEWQKIAQKAIAKLKALSKAQEPRLLTLDEIHDSMVVYLEAGTKFLKIVNDDGVVLAIGGSDRTGAKCFITVWDVCVAAKDNEYNVTWRAWSERPTKEQREGTPWKSVK